MFFGRTYTNADTVSKILRFLPKTYEVKVMTIREIKDLTKLSLEELIRSLMTLEITMENKKTRREVKEEFGIQNCIPY